jgi:hypothetical protein
VLRLPSAACGARRLRQHAVEFVGLVRVFQPWRPDMIDISAASVFSLGDRAVNRLGYGAMQLAVRRRGTKLRLLNAADVSQWVPTPRNDRS